jgi:hypothetical protein
MHLRATPWVLVALHEISLRRLMTSLAVQGLVPMWMFPMREQHAYCTYREGHTFSCETEIPHIHLTMDDALHCKYFRPHVIA